MIALAKPTAAHIVYSLSPIAEFVMPLTKLTLSVAA
jgi:hypothetical protein